MYVRTIQWGGNEGDGGKSRWFAVERGRRQRCPLSPLLFNIYLMGMAEEKGGGAGHLCMLLLFWWQTQGQRLQAMLDVVEAHVAGGR